jgi:ABC-type bacteriocin/lantibiotic exporter with double-glycine peptidase domain
MNVPHFQQELDYSCLPACVRMVLAFYGEQRSELELRRLLKTRVTGTSPAAVMMRLPEIGFEAQVLEASRYLLRKHIESDEPCIAHIWTATLPHWSDDVVHAVVVTDLDDDTIWINDPILASGPTRVAQTAFFAAWAATDHTLIVMKDVRSMLVG